MILAPSPHFSPQFHDFTNTSSSMRIAIKKYLLFGLFPNHFFLHLLKKMTFAKSCMTKGGGGFQQKVTNDDKTLRGEGALLLLLIVM